MRKYGGGRAADMCLFVQGGVRVVVSQGGWWWGGAKTKRWTWAYLEKLQMQLVLLIILEPTKIVFAETPER